MNKPLAAVDCQGAGFQKVCQQETKGQSVFSAALDYARKGIPVFPCNIDKRPITPHGFKDATTDPDTIRRWWVQHPDALIGSPTCEKDFVFDVDAPDGPASLATLEEQHGALPPTREQATGGGGRQLFFKVPPGIEIKNSAGKIGVNLDIRGIGGYVILPPSLHKSGKRYRWVNNLPPADAPDWLLDLIIATCTRVEPTPSNGDNRPGDDYNMRGDVRPLLERAGWQFFKHSGANEHWTRPGKNTGNSGTIFEDGSFYSFTGNAPPVESYKRYSRYALYALLEHNGDWTAAARQLARDGYGERKEVDRKLYRLNELGNAERFADEHGADVRFVPALKKWIAYDGRRWQIGAEEQIRKLAHQTAKNLYALAAQEEDNEIAGRLAKWAATSCKSSSISAMLKEAAAMLAIDISELDADPMLFNCANCTINLHTGKVQPHNKPDFITKITEIPFHPDAEAPLFEQVVNTAFQGNANLIQFLQKYMGYAMTGSTKEQCFAILYGTGSNGKSTIMNPIEKALGEYAQTTRPETLMAKRDSGIPSDIAKLKGARLVLASESEDGHRLAEAAIKQMTGGEKIQARALYSDWFEFIPQFKIVLCTNHKPVIRGDDYAIWRRIRLIPFMNVIPEEERDLDLADKLKKELPGILTWIVKGAAAWLTEGLGQPEEVVEATTSYKTEQNVLSLFLEHCCILRTDATAESSQLFMEFDKWRTREGHRRITQTKFGMMLSDAGFEKFKTGGRFTYCGIGLNYPHCPA